MLPTDPFWTHGVLYHTGKSLYVRARPSTWEMIHEASDDAYMQPKAAVEARSSATITLNLQDGLYNPVVFDNYEINPGQYWADLLDDAAITRLGVAVVKDPHFWGLTNHDDAVRVMKAMSKLVIPYTFTVDGKSVGENWIWDYRGDRSRFFNPSDAFYVWFNDHEMVPKSRRAGRCACPPTMTKRRKR